MITLFENFKNKPDVNSLSPEFWEMVRIANWKDAIKLYLSDRGIDSYNQEKRDEYWDRMKFRIYSKYDYEKIKEFENEYHQFYMKLYDYFHDIWLDDEYNSFMPSDDGYSDLLSSIIGMGKTITKKCIDDTDKFVTIARDGYFIENFGYLFHDSEKEYLDIIQKYDPENIKVSIRNYNV